MKIAPDQKEKTSLVRQLGLFDTMMITIGIVIGSGIFLTTGLMAKGIPSASLILLAWLFGGLHALAGALTYAELGASMPQAGGQYVYLREAYGPFYGFLFGVAGEERDVDLSCQCFKLIDSGRSVDIGRSDHDGFFFDVF